MIRGTTAPFKFKLPCAKGELESVTIRFWQSNNPSILLPITKELIHCDGNDNLNELCVSLTAEETMRFSDQYKAKVQLRATHSTSGAVFGTRPQLVKVYPYRNDTPGDVPPGTMEDGFVVLDGQNVT